MTEREQILQRFAPMQGVLAERIQNGIEARKSRTALTITDAQGKKLTGRVRAKLVNHEFLHGANLFMLDEFPTADANAAYRELFPKYFNTATLPFYWDTLEPEQGKPRYAIGSPRIYRRPVPDLCLEYCEKAGIMPKAHCLAYCGFWPKWIDRNDPEREAELLKKRFAELAERYAGRIRDWEVVNELFWRPGRVQSGMYEQPGFVEWCFAEAAKVFPHNRLLINEGQTRAWGLDHFDGDRSSYYMLIDRAMMKGARVDAIGMQFHMFHRREAEAEKTEYYYMPERMWKILDTYAMLGRPVQITEMTIPAYSKETADESFQAEVLRNLVTLWFAHPVMEGVYYWNTVDGYAHGTTPGDMTSGENYYHGGLLRFDFTQKPALQMLENLFQHEWHTETEAATTDGSFTLEGFRGTYALEMQTDSGVFKGKVKLSQDKKVQPVIMEAEK